MTAAAAAELEEGIEDEDWTDFELSDEEEPDWPADDDR